MGGKNHYTEADDAALVELVGTCSDRQLSAYLGRPVSSIKDRLTTLRKRGQLDRRLRRTKVRVPFDIPSNAILVAKTCPKCGKFKAARHYSLNRGNRGARQHSCTTCGGGHQAGIDWVKLMQKITSDQASKRRDPYTDTDMELISDRSKSSVEVALTIGRSYYAIETRRKIMGITTPRKPTEEWFIHFPNAVKALQEHFIRLGVPDDQWDEVA